jgi:hypothetical protein
VRRRPPERPTRRAAGGSWRGGGGGRVRCAGARGRAPAFGGVLEAGDNVLVPVPRCIPAQEPARIRPRADGPCHWGAGGRGGRLRVGSIRVAAARAVRAVIAIRPSALVIFAGVRVTGKVTALKAAKYEHGKSMRKVPCPKREHSKSPHGYVSNLKRWTCVMNSSSQYMHNWMGCIRVLLLLIASNIPKAVPPARE